MALNKQTKHMRHSNNAKDRAAYNQIGLHSRVLLQGAAPKRGYSPERITSGTARTTRRVVSVPVVKQNQRKGAAPSHPRVTAASSDPRTACASPWSTQEIDPQAVAMSYGLSDLQ